MVLSNSDIRMSGATDSAIAEALGVCRATIFRWRDEHPEFAAAVEEAKRIANDRVKQSLFARANGWVNPNAVKIFMPAGAPGPVYAPYTEYLPPDAGAAFNWLKNREPAEWRDRIEHTGEGGGPIEISWQVAASVGQISPPVSAGDLARDVTPQVIDVAPEPVAAPVSIGWADQTEENPTPKAKRGKS